MNLCPFAIDRAGLVGNDGETHQGAYDIAFLNHIPNMTILSPKNKWELEEMMRFAIAHPGPVAIRYPRGSAYMGLESYQEPICLGKSEWIHRGRQIAILSAGHMMETAEKVWAGLKEKGYEPSLVNGRFVKPIDGELLMELEKDHTLYVTIEDASVIGGFGANVTAFVSEEKLQVEVLINGIPDVYVEHGNIQQLREKIQLDADSIIRKIEAAYHN